MKNFVQPGNTLTLIAPLGGVMSGSGVLVGSIFAVAAFVAAEGEEFEGTVEGVFTLPKAAGAIPQGAKVYWDDAAKNITTVSSGNTLIGVATVAAADADPEASVRLNGSF